MEFDFDFLFFSAGIFISLPLFWHVLSLKKSEEKSKKVSTLVVLGSGGHTAEMLRLVSGLDLNIYSPLTFVLAETDLRSEEKLALSFGSRKYQVLKLPRAREVSQSWISSVISFIKVR
jgi:beta-1,4-N-acetylglucosaminyltransferase